MGYVCEYNRKDKKYIYTEHCPENVLNSIHFCREKDTEDNTGVDIR
jgi:hypothetical protein